MVPGIPMVSQSLGHQCARRTIDQPVRYAVLIAYRCVMWRHKPQSFRKIYERIAKNPGTSSFVHPGRGICTEYIYGVHAKHFILNFGKATCTWSFMYLTMT